MVAALIIVALLIVFAAGGVLVMRLAEGGSSGMKRKVLASGDLLVTGKGDVTVDRVIPRSRALLVDFADYVIVEFDPRSPPPPPCASGHEDELGWRLLTKRVQRPGQPDGEELKLNISWHVSAARTIVWRIYVPA